MPPLFAESLTFWPRADRAAGGPAAAAAIAAIVLADGPRCRAECTTAVADDGVDGAVDDDEDGAAEGGDERAEAECGRVGADDADVLFSEEVVAVEGELGVASDDDDDE